MKPSTIHRVGAKPVAAIDVLETGALPSVPADLRAALRSDHAGETGAVYIYRGIEAISGDPELLRFAAAHRATEEQHLELMNQLVPAGERSRLLPVWRLAGWLTGALPSLLGRPAVFRTIGAVETFVDFHYQAQIDELEGRPEHAGLRALLVSCRDDEREHRDEALEHLDPPGLLARLWIAMVASGSKIGVLLASRF